MKLAFLPLVLALAATACVRGEPTVRAPGEAVPVDRRAVQPDSPPQGETHPYEPTRVILFIGDGVGTSYWTAARIAAGHLAVEDFPVAGLVDTRNVSGRVIDSAAAATTLASGIPTYNAAIGVDPDTQAVHTVVHEARARRMATGLVATSAITHATPAAFAAAVPHRRQESEIARQMVERGIEVLIGGGRRFFDGTAPGATDLLPRLRATHRLITDPTELRGADLTGVERLAALVADAGLPPAADRELALAEMTAAALTVLETYPAGFFLMVEGSQADWRGHDNDPIEAVVAEMLDFDDAIGHALEFQRRHPATLIVVTSDHETGGLAVRMDAEGRTVAAYTTTGHTAAMVPLFASGPGAENFAGMKEMARIGELLLEAVRGGRPVTASPRR